MNELFTASLGIVALGGLIGGALQPVVATLHPRIDAPPNIHYLFSPLLGVAAAGISVFVLANTETDKSDWLELLFFSVLCGLAFPAILTSAIDNVGKRTGEVQREMTGIAQQAVSNNPATVVATGDKLKEVIIANPAATITTDGQKAVETTGQLAVKNLAETVAADPAQAREVVEQLKEVATVAKSAGYIDLAQSTGAELAKLAESNDITDKDTKKLAETFAERINAT